MIPSRTINSIVCFVTGSSSCYKIAKSSTKERREEEENIIQGKVWEKCGTKTRKQGAWSVRNGNSDGLDSLIKFSIHIHSLARRKSIQVASSLVLPSC